MKRCVWLLVVFLAGLAGAEEADGISGHIAIGWRDVSLDGDRAKYKEDINLESGPRLFDANIVLTPYAESDNWPDLIEIDLQGIGGDPYESLRLNLRKYDSYHFVVRRRRSDYFYNDVIVPPEEASLDGSTGGDFHSYDFERVRDDVSLKLKLSDDADARLGFERYQKRGSSTTTLDIQRDEFEFDKPIDESMQVISIGASYEWSSAVLSFEERIRDYENQNSLFLPGFSEGHNPADPTELDFYFLDQPYEYRSYEHRATLIVQPSAKLHVNVSAAASDLDLRTVTAERAQGVDFMGNVFESDFSGDGDIDRDFAVLGFDVKYLMNDRLQLIAGGKSHQLDQSGRATHGPNDGGIGEWDIETTSLNMALLMSVSSRMTFSAGWIGERRDTRILEQPTGDTRSGETVESDSDGLYGSLDLRLGDRLKLTASINDTAIDEPFTLASASDVTRYRVRAKYYSDNGWAFVVSQGKNKRKNGASSWSSDNEQTDVRVTYSSGTLQVSAGATRVDTSRKFQRLVTGGFRQDLFDVAYDADTSYVQAALDWTPTDRWRLGAAYRDYDSTGSFLVERRDYSASGELKLTSDYSLRLFYRNVDFSEPGTEQYDADIIEASLILRF